MCTNYQKRQGILDQMRAPGKTSEQRKKLMDELKLYPTVAYATQQAMYADFCKVPANSAKDTCSRLKQTQSSVVMRTWYCGQPGKAESPWCKRSAILEQLQKIPVSTSDTAQAEQRKKLTAEYAAFARPAPGGGPSQSTLCLLYTSPSPRDGLLSRMPSSA